MTWYLNACLFVLSYKNYTIIPCRSIQVINCQTAPAPGTAFLAAVQDLFARQMRAWHPM